MAFNTEIITSTEVRDLSIDDVDFDTAYFDNYILTSQRKYLKGILGKDFYNEILDEVENATLTADNETLLDSFIKPMLAHYIVYEVYPKIHSQLSNQGIMMNDTEFSDQAKSFDYSQSRDFYMNKASFWANDMITYIKEVKEDDDTKYPLFDDCDSNDGKGLNKRGIIFY